MKKFLLGIKYNFKSIFKILSLLGFVLGTFTSSAQYIPIPTDSTAFWKVEWYDYQNCGPIQPNASYRTYFSGDTLINGLNYAKAYNAGYSQCFPLGYAGALRNDSVNRKVYFVEVDSANEKVLYDFNLNPGDTLPQIDNLAPAIFVNTVDTILINSVFRKRIEFSYLGGIYGPFIIEGIGSMTGLLSPIFSAETQFDLICFSQHNQPVFPDTSTSCFVLFNKVNELQSNQLVIYPNPIENSATIKSNHLLKELKLIDINGRVVLDELIGSSVYTLNRSMFVSGFYVCEIITNEGSVYYRKIFLK